MRVKFWKQDCRRSNCGRVSKYAYSRNKTYALVYRGE
jgi:hypothetical protein